MQLSGTSIHVVDRGCPCGMTGRFSWATHCHTWVPENVSVPAFLILRSEPVDGYKQGFVSIRCVSLDK